MRLELITQTTNADVIIATAVLTTASKSSPSTLFQRLKSDPKKVADILDRIEVQHGSILDHNRLCWRMEATEREVLEILLKHRFFSFTRLEGNKWLMSSNLRTAISYIQDYNDPFSEALMDTIPGCFATILRKIRGRLY